MFRPEEMTKVSLVSSKGMLRKVVEQLYDMKLLHIDEFKKADGYFDLGRPFAEVAGYSEQLIKLRSMISYFKISSTPKEVKDLSDAKIKLNYLNKETTELIDKINNLRSEDARLNEVLSNPVITLEFNKKHLNLRSIVPFVGTVKKKFLEQMEGKDYEIVKKEMNSTVAIALFVPKKEADEVRKLLDKYGFTQYPIPDMGYGKASDVLKDVQKELADATSELEKTKKSNRQFLIDYEYTLQQLVEKDEAPLRFAASSRAFVATGWIPAKKKAEFESQITKITCNKVALYYGEAGHDAPIALENPKPAKPFEFLLDLFTLPRYGEIDPTFIFLITFPLFFGFMLGDVGYGIAVLALTFLVQKIFPPGMKPIFNIVRIAAVATIAFGFVFGEFFGLEFIEHPLLNRMHDINTMLLISAVMGAVHLNLGLALGFINEARMHGIKKAIFAKGSWYVIETGIVSLGLGAVMFNSLVLQIIGAAMLLPGIIMLYKGEGIKGVVELPTLLSNTLSYMRLFAIGLASVALAVVINESAIGLIQQGGMMVVLAVLILVMGHFINLLLGVMGAFLHALRLHYVEFFTKFFEGGGNKYTPFGSVKKWR
ncbi:V-type ATP synthase subunit I [archaeon]|nr:MAG: V-type ATP synthase subunit I [archaeon]